MVILCKICHLPKPELQPMAEFKSLKAMENSWICEGCRNSYIMFRQAPAPTLNKHCRVCGKVIRIVRKNGSKDICFLCKERGVTCIVKLIGLFYFLLAKSF